MECTLKTTVAFLSNSRPTNRS